MASKFHYDWSDLAFASKKPIKELRAIFIVAPRELSVKRFAQLMKQYLPQGNIVLGLAKESYIAGFEGQPQFRTLRYKSVGEVIDKVNNAETPNKIYSIDYFQRELVNVAEKLNFKKVVLVNGSWQYVFHNSPLFYTLVKEKIPYDMVSPFCDEDEARSYADALTKEIAATWSSELSLDKEKAYADSQLMGRAAVVAKASFDNTFQTGAVLAAKRSDDNLYSPLLDAHNTVVPFETYALHYGALREKNFSPSNDLNHYDTVHAETQLMLNALSGKQSLKGTSLFVNLLPCPTCARMLSQTEITEIVYQNDHSDGYAVKLLEKAGKTVRRLVI